jgi:hypothetical protein
MLYLMADIYAPLLGHLACRRLFIFVPAALFGNKT